jgi:ribosomal protein S1
MLSKKESLVPFSSFLGKSSQFNYNSYLIGTVVSIKSRFIFLELEKRFIVKVPKTKLISYQLGQKIIFKLIKSMGADILIQNFKLRYQVSKLLNLFLIRYHFQTKKPVKGLVLQRLGGGFLIKVLGTAAFMPHRFLLKTKVPIISVWFSKTRESLGLWFDIKILRVHACGRKRLRVCGPVVKFA